MSAHSEEASRLIEDRLTGNDLTAGGSVTLEAGPDAAGQRLDQWLASQLGPDMSRSRVQMLIKQGAVRIGGKIVEEAKRKMAAGEHVSVEMPEPEPVGTVVAAVPQNPIQGPPPEAPPKKRNPVVRAFQRVFGGKARD